MKYIFILSFLFFNAISFADTLLLGTTSTTVNSGLMDYLLPYYTENTGHDIKVITGGTGFILQQLERGDIEIAITHQEDMEKKLLEKFPQGKRSSFMYNHFIIVGPLDDPASIAKTNSFPEAMKHIADHKSLFISRGDMSGSHVFELEIWQALNVPTEARQPSWYIEAGQDMGATLNMASSMQAYMIADEGTWLAYANRSQLKVLYAKKNEGKNNYSVIQLTTSDELPEPAAEFIDWLLQTETLELIDRYQINGVTGFWHIPK